MRKKQLFALLGALVIGVSTAACGNSGTASAVENSTAQKSTAAEDTAVQENTAAEDTAAQESTTAENTTAQESAAAEDSGFTPEDSLLSEDGSVIEFPETGITFTLPESFKNTKGFLPNGGSEIAEGDGVYYMYYNYVGFSEDDYNDLLLQYRNDSENPEKYENFFNPRVLGLFSIYAADKNRTAEDINAYLKKLYEDRGTPSDKENLLEGAQLIGTAGEYNFYYLDETNPDADLNEADSFFTEKYDLSGYQEEYDALIEDVKNNCADLLEFSEPLKSSAYAEPGTVISFDTADLDGQAVSSKDLFSQNKITMVNIWGTFCEPCINEMPELEKLYTELAEKGCGIIGIVGDADGSESASIIEKAKTILSDNGVTYPNILPWDDLYEQFPFTAFPTTYFVDSEGNVIGSPVVGAYVQRYSTKLQEALEEIGR